MQSRGGPGWFNSTHLMESEAPNWVERVRPTQEACMAQVVGRITWRLLVFHHRGHLLFQMAKPNEGTRVQVRTPCATVTIRKDRTGGRVFLGGWSNLGHTASLVLPARQICRSVRQEQFRATYRHGWRLPQGKGMDMSLLQGGSNQL